jgi:hypothetical protein
VHQVGRRPRLEQEPGELADLERDLERGPVVDPACDDGAAADDGVHLQCRDVLEGQLDLRLNARRHLLQLRQRLLVARRPAEEQSDRPQRVEVRLGRCNRLFLARLERQHLLGNPAERRVRPVRDRDRRPALAARLLDHGEDVRRLARL